jgi:hypothetical protein
MRHGQIIILDKGMGVTELNPSNEKVKTAGKSATQAA